MVIIQSRGDINQADELPPIWLTLLYNGTREVDMNDNIYTSLMPFDELKTTFIHAFLSGNSWSNAI